MAVVMLQRYLRLILLTVTVATVVQIGMLSVGIVQEMNLEMGWVLSIPILGPMLGEKPVDFWGHVG